MIFLWLSRPIYIYISPPGIRMKFVGSLANNSIKSSCRQLNEGFRKSFRSATSRSVLSGIMSKNNYFFFFFRISSTTTIEIIIIWAMCFVKLNYSPDQFSSFLNTYEDTDRQGVQAHGLQLENTLKRLYIYIYIYMYTERFPRLDHPTSPTFSDTCMHVTCNNKVNFSDEIVD